jgi:crossover junction endodeoxyribonuclease RusA
MNDESARLETFEFTVEGPPVSLKAKKNNTKRYQRWIRTVRAAAHAQWTADRKPTNSRAVVVAITNYYTLSPPDVDNIIKPIMDALNTVVYFDDQQVHRVVSEKFDLSNVARLPNPSPLLAAALENYTELLHIKVMWEGED